MLKPPFRRPNGYFYTYVPAHNGIPGKHVSLRTKSPAEAKRKQMELFRMEGISDDRGFQPGDLNAVGDSAGVVGAGDMPVSTVDPREVLESVASETFAAPEP